MPARPSTPAQPSIPAQPDARPDSSDLLSHAANEMQHDAVLDYYGRRLATCSSDKTIKIFEVEGEKHTLVETLRGYVTAMRRVLFIGH
jgi:hypothetical protein